jgi:hypothetical protein
MEPLVMMELRVKMDYKGKKEILVRQAVLVLQENRV